MIGHSLAIYEIGVGSLGNSLAAGQCIPYKSVNDENIFNITDLGGIKAIIAAMQRHSGDSAVQKAGCGALNNLGLYDEEYQDKITELGGIEAVLAAMHGHSTDCGLQGTCCAALGNLANRKNLDKITELGGIEAIWTAIRGHSQDVTVQAVGEEALEILAMLEGNSADYDVQAMEHGALENFAMEGQTNDNEAGVNPNQLNAQVTSKSQFTLRGVVISASLVCYLVFWALQCHSKTQRCIENNCYLLASYL